MPSYLDRVEEEELEWKRNISRLHKMYPQFTQQGTWSRKTGITSNDLHQELVSMVLAHMNTRENKLCFRFCEVRNSPWPASLETSLQWCTEHPVTYVTWLAILWECSSGNKHWKVCIPNTEYETCPSQIIERWQTSWKNDHLSFLINFDRQNWSLHRYGTKFIKSDNQMSVASFEALAPIATAVKNKPLKVCLSWMTGILRR